MAMDPFSAEIVKLVRNMSDEAILALVKNQLGRVSSSASAAATATVAAAASKAGRKPGPKPKAAPPPPPPPAPKPPTPRPGLIAAKPAGRPPVVVCGRSAAGRAGDRRCSQEGAGWTSLTAR